MIEINEKEYSANIAFDELLDEKRQPRPAARALFNYLNALPPGELESRREAVEAAILTMGITFTVYSEGTNIDRAWPFDIVPRTIAKSEWLRIEEGLKQRLTALNLFINNLYNEQRIVKDGVFPLEVLTGSKNFRPQCQGFTPRFGVWAHICGTDLLLRPYEVLSGIANPPVLEVGHNALGGIAPTSSCGRWPLDVTWHGF